MTTWDDWPSHRRLRALAAASYGGAAQSGALAASSFAEFIERLVGYAPEAFPDAAVDLAAEIASRQAAVAPLVAMANIVFLGLERGPDAVITDLRGFEEQVASATDTLAGVGAAMVPEDALVLTHGGSRTVRSVLVAAAADRRIHAVCTESRPLGEGVELAAELAASGVEVEVVADDEALDEVSDMDLVMVGTHALGPGLAINSIGTAEIVKEARNVGVDVVVVSSVVKALPAVLFDRAAAAAAATGIMETFPLSDVSAVVTEQGVVDARAAAHLAEQVAVAPQLSG